MIEYRFNYSEPGGTEMYLPPMGGGTFQSRPPSVHIFLNLLILKLKCKKLNIVIIFFNVN